MRNSIARPQIGHYDKQAAVNRWRPYVALPHTPPPPAYPVPPRASLVRPYVLHVERQREQRRADRSRLGLAVLVDLARSLKVDA